MSKCSYLEAFRENGLYCERGIADMKQYMTVKEVCEDLLADGGMICPACGEELEFDYSELFNEEDEEEDTEEDR